VTKLLSKVCVLSDFCMLHYTMGYYFLHQEVQKDFDEQCKRYEAQLEEEKQQQYREIQNLTVEQENVRRETEVSCLCTKIVHCYSVLCDRNM
jgi:uncharacterized protein YeaO (DUF488 family)